MLDDPRAQAFVSNFGGQWLHLRNLETITPDPDIFPNFDEGLRQAFRRETELFFESVLRENRSVFDLLDANYTFLNQRLAEHYGVRGRLRFAVPPRHAERSEPERTVGTRQHPDRNLISESGRL